MAAKSLTYIKTLDGLRAMAILLVMGHHFFSQPIPGYLPDGPALWFKGLMSFAWSGVDLFFMLSGFLIGRILLIQKGSAHFFSAFYLRRAFRILPPYFLLLAGFGLFIKLGGYTMSSWLFEAAFPWYSYCLFIQNFWMASAGHFGANWLAPTWSLAVEEQFYLLLPLAIYFMPMRRMPWLLVSGIVVAIVYRFMVSDMAAYVLLPARLDALFVGVLLAWVYLRGGLASGKIHSRRVLWAALLLLLLLYTYIALTGASLGNAWLHTLLTLFYGCLMVFAIANANNQRVNRYLANKVVRFIARISYSLYIWHQVCNGLVHAWLKNSEPNTQTFTDVLIAIMGIALTFLIATGSYYLLEKPLLRYAKKFDFKSEHKLPEGV
jgi:peptidoglycan/LPS O-acetylase OafA/YrhL